MAPASDAPLPDAETAADAASFPAAARSDSIFKEDPMAAPKESVSVTADEVTEGTGGDTTGSIVRLTQPLMKAVRRGI